MAKQKGAVPALRLNLGGAPNVWHAVADLPGLWHPTIAVPVDAVEGSEEWASPLHDDAGCPLELVHISEDEATTGREAFAKATGQSLDALLARLHKDIPVLPGGFEEQRIAAEHQNVMATVPDEPKE